VDSGLLERLRGLDVCCRTLRKIKAPMTEEPSSTIADPELLALLRKVRNCPPGS